MTSLLLVMSSCRERPWQCLEARFVIASIPAVSHTLSLSLVSLPMKLQSCSGSVLTPLCCDSQPLIQLCCCTLSDNICDKSKKMF